MAASAVLEPSSGIRIRLASITVLSGELLLGSTALVTARRGPLRAARVRLPRGGMHEPAAKTRLRVLLRALRALCVPYHVSALITDREWSPHAALLERTPRASPIPKASLLRLDRDRRALGRRRLRHRHDQQAILE